MPSSPPDTISSQMKKGIKNVFNRRPRRGTDESGDMADDPGYGQPGSEASPVEAPSRRSISERSPQLTTPIPGSSLDAEISVPMEAEETPIPAASLSQTSPAQHYSGMSATSGPLGNSLEEVEEFERMQERRSSAISEAQAAEAAAAHKTSSEQQSSSRMSLDSNRGTADATSKPDTTSMEIDHPTDANTSTS